MEGRGTPFLPRAGAVLLNSRKDVMKNFIRVGLAAVVVTVGVSAQADMFEITWTNHGPQPLSPLFWSTSDSSFDIFQVGGTASQGIKDIAESGSTTAMLAIAGAAGSSVGSFGVLTPGPLMPGNTRSGVFEATSSHGYFSFASMLGMTNDGWIGEGVSSMGLMLYDAGNNPTGFTLQIFGNRAWDAGTELNTQDAADLAALGGSGNPADNPDVIRVHESILPNVGDSWDQLPDWETSTLLSTIEVEVVPEPMTMSILGLGALALLRKKRSA